MEILPSQTPTPEPSPRCRTGECCSTTGARHCGPFITDALVGLIDGTPAGESIVLSCFVIPAGHPVIDALLRLQPWGVGQV